MQVETALFFETVEQIYGRVLRVIKPRTPLPEITVHFRKYANANSRIRLSENRITVEISDLLEPAPAPIQEALAFILLGKLYRKALEPEVLARYRRYLNRSDIRRSVQLAKQKRGRKMFRDAAGRTYNLHDIFRELNFTYFHGLMAEPQIGWSIRTSRTVLGHYDPSHHVIVLSSLLDSAEAPPLVVKYVMFHEMLHLQHPTQHHGSRRCIHTREFKADEKMFAEYRAARAALKEFMDRIYKSEPGHNLKRIGE